MSKKSNKQVVYKRDNASLRDQITKLKDDHARALAAKNQALEAQSRGLIFELGATFPALRDLVAQLHRAATATSPLRSPGGGESRSAKIRGPDEMAASTESERSFIEELNSDLALLATKAGRRFSHRERGPIRDVYRPQCWNPDCRSRSVAQSFERKECVTCGEPFGRYKPLKDLTAPGDTRCFVRGCPGRNRVDQCIHSWQKMGEPT